MGLLNIRLVLLTLMVSLSGMVKVAVADCSWDQQKQQIICIPDDDDPVIGPDGGNWNVRHELFSLILQHPRILVQELRMPDDLNAVDTELIRQALESKRQNVEAFRNWIETEQFAKAVTPEYNTGMQIYHEGITQYRLDIEKLR